MSTFLTRLLERSLAPHDTVRPIVQPLTAPEPSIDGTSDEPDVLISHQLPLASIAPRPGRLAVAEERGPHTRLDALRISGVEHRRVIPEIPRAIDEDVSADLPQSIAAHPGERSGSEGERTPPREVGSPDTTRESRVPEPAVRTMERVTQSIMSRDVAGGIVVRERPSDQGREPRIVEVRRLDSPPLAARERQRTAEQAPSPAAPVRVSIGRIEVHVEQAPQSERVVPRQRPTPTVTLGDYLVRQRRTAK